MQRCTLYTRYAGYSRAHKVCLICHVCVSGVGLARRPVAVSAARPARGGDLPGGGAWAAALRVQTKKLSAMAHARRATAFEAPRMAVI